MNMRLYSGWIRNYTRLAALEALISKSDVIFESNNFFIIIPAYSACLNSVERYDFRTKAWETVAPLNLPRRALMAVAMPDGIYAIGGFDGENYLCTVERYDETLNEWTFVSSMNYARCTFSAVASSDYQNIYVFGGFDNGPLNTAERYPCSFCRLNAQNLI